MTVYTVHAATVDTNGIVTSITTATLSTEGETVDGMGQPVDVVIQDLDGNPQILTPEEWNDATGGGGVGLNGQGGAYIFDGGPGGAGTVYYPLSYSNPMVGQDISDILATFTNNFTPIDINEIVTCFTRGTRIATPEGSVPIEDLSIGDLVLNAQNKPVEIRWIGHRHLNLGFSPDLVPVRIAANALGAGLPARDLLVSPEHRVLISNEKLSLLFGCDEALVAARHLVNDSTITTCRDLVEVDYFHLLFDSHEIVIAEGVLTESLYPDATALGRMGEPALNELLKIFPELSEPEKQPSMPFGPHAYPVMRGVETKLLGTTFFC
jgi:Hint domain